VAALDGASLHNPPTDRRIPRVVEVAKNLLGYRSVTQAWASNGPATSVHRYWCIEAAMLPEEPKGG